VSTATDIIAVSFAGGSLVISGWAGYTAHKARQWQRDRDEERRATHVRVEFAHALFESNYTLTLVAMNQGESIEYVTAAFVEQAAADEDGHTWMMLEHEGVRVFGDEGHEGTEPYELRPRGVLRAPTDLTDEQVAALRDGFVGLVLLGSGAEAISGIEYLEDDILDDLA
jgi:hypothetical protein